MYVLIAYALLVAASVPLLLGPKFLQWMEFVNMGVTWVYKFAHIIVLAARAKAGRRSAKYAFTHYEPQYSGWGDGWTFFIGFLPASYSNCAPGFILSMTEEVKDPAINVPRAMSYTMMPFSLIMAWMYILPLTFTMPPSEVLLEAPGGIILPYAYKLIVGNDAGAVLLMFGLLYIGFNCLPCRHQRHRLTPTLVLLARQGRSWFEGVGPRHAWRQRPGRHHPLPHHPSPSHSYQPGQRHRLQLVCRHRRQRLHGRICPSHSA